MAEALAELGVDVIEAGFPIASPGDFESVQSIAQKFAEGRPGHRRPGRANAGRHPARARGAEAGRPQAHPHLPRRPRAAHASQAADDAGGGAGPDDRPASRWRRQHSDDVEWSAEDGSRTDPDFLCRCVEAAIKAGATTINIPDTVGYAMPEDMARIIRNLRNRVPGIEKVVLSATTTTTSAWRWPTPWPRPGRRRQIECTINGIGERAGNASLEEVVMALRTRRDALPCQQPASSRPEHPADPQAAGHHHRHRRAAEQGDRRPQRLRPRGRHPPGRHAEGRRRPTRS